MARGDPGLAPIFLALGGMLIATPAQGKRVALVMGNSAYKHAPELENTRNDATDMAAALKALGGCRRAPSGSTPRALAQRRHFRREQL